MACLRVCIACNQRRCGHAIGWQNGTAAARNPEFGHSRHHCCGATSANLEK
jgi:hypothetical protein